MSTINLETESLIEVARGWGGGSRELLFDKYRVSVQDGWKKKSGNSGDDYKAL